MSSSEENSDNVPTYYFLFFSALLALVLILSKYLHQQRCLNSFVSEAALVLLVGMGAGFVVHYFILKRFNNEEEALQDDDNDDVEERLVAETLLSFAPNVFYMALMPPILFNSGYQLRRELFYRHIKPIALFACVGTTISAFTTAIVLFTVKLFGGFGDFSPTLLELLAFGALIAATDTVSVLAVFQTKRVDPHLFYVVFGESALNDAVALVLFHTFSDFIVEHFDGAGSVLRRFFVVLLDVFLEALGSPMLGIISGFVVALIFKCVDLREHKMLELSLFMLMMYMPFMIAECMMMSGIVTIFFTGMSARRYVAPNVSEETAINGELVFKLSAFLAETCIFLELGLSVFGLKGSFQFKFIIWAFCAALLGRAAGIYPLAYYHNLSIREIHEDGTSMDSDDEMRGGGNQCMDIPRFPSFESVDTESSPRKSKLRTPHVCKDLKISANKAHMLWFAGLRGAVAYACARDFPNVFGHQDEIVATTMTIVLVTIIAMGGATGLMLQWLGIEVGVDVDEYMENWHKQRKLNGAFHEFETEYMYPMVVRENNTKSDSSGENFDISTDPAFNYKEYETTQQKRSVKQRPLPEIQ